MCERVLFNMLSELSQPGDPWDSVLPSAGPAMQLQGCTFKDVDNARATCKLFREIIDGTPEWACIRLARHDYFKEDKPWETEENFVMHAFAQNWRLFSTSWKLATPIADERLRLGDIGTLSDKELSDLRYLLNTSENHEMMLGPDDKLRQKADVWVCPGHRSWSED